jgi:hypothetical protein
MDFQIFTNRFSMLFYFFNNLRTLFFFPEGERKNLLSECMNQLDNLIENENNKLSNVLSINIQNYYQIKELFYIITDSRNNLTDLIKEKFCPDIIECQNYLDSDYNIFHSGIDFALRTCLAQIGNIYRDYKSLENKTDINEINITLIHNPHFKFIYIGNSINNMFIYVKEKIFQYFKNDIENFNKLNYNKVISFNIISIIFSIFLFLFVVIYIFISISKFSEPIKKSSYRINYSFYYIKKYSLDKCNK